MKKDQISNRTSSSRFFPATTIVTQAIRLSLLMLIGLSILIVTPRQQAQSQCDRVLREGCNFNKPTKLVLLLDRSGSMAPRGQTYNAQIEGAIRALKDPTIIPRDGSVEVGVVAFAEAASILPVNQKLLTRINSMADADAVAAAIATLKCANLGSQSFPCPFGATSYASAIQTGDILLNREGRFGAQRILVLSTDGQTFDSDLEEAVGRVLEASRNAKLQGLSFEMDTILMGVDAASEEFPISKARVDALALPQPASDLPGQSIAISTGDCNVTGTPTTNADCDRQATTYANQIRAILRSSVKPISLVVNTDADTPAGTPITGGVVSLRQAIEAANCNGGLATITFDTSLRGKTIRPAFPLPSLIAPEITIDGCDGSTCAPIVTIDGTDTDVTAGESHSDGILIRSYKNVVRGLRIIKFKRAGIAVDPLCPADVTVNNRIERNVLEMNGVAGVLIKDPPTDSTPAIAHSVGNTISRNTISDSPTLIDLGGNGATPNDANDADEGANTLLNFPNSLNVVTAANNTVNISGQVSGANLTGATVELFAVTKFSVVENVLVINGVSFLGAATVAENGMFTASNLPVSPTGIYTATVTDLAGNTSEIMFENATVKPGRPLSSSTPTVSFGDVTVNATSTARPVVLMNTGNAPLIVTSCTLAACATSDRNDTARFAVTGCPTTPINPGEQATINVTVSPNACGSLKACLLLNTNDPFTPQIKTELTANGNAVGAGKLTIEGSSSNVIDFGSVNLRTKGVKKKKQPKRNFTVENTGCQPLTLNVGKIMRTGAAVTSGKITNADDSAFYTLQAVNSDGSLSPVTSPIVLVFGERRNFRVTFNPTIPAVTSKTTGLAASDVLPDTVTSQLTITQNGGNPLVVNLTGKVSTNLRLINPTDPGATPVVDFTRTGDIFSVSFSIFDSNLNANRATYEFIDRQGRTVGQIIEVNMTQEIQARGLVTGQSFTVTQRFSGAKDNSKITQVRVTVSDDEASVSATADLIVSSSIQQQSLKLATPSVAGSDTNIVLPKRGLKKMVHGALYDKLCHAKPPCCLVEPFINDNPNEAKLRSLMYWRNSLETPDNQISGVVMRNVVTKEEKTSESLPEITEEEMKRQGLTIESRIGPVLGAGSVVLEWVVLSDGRKAILVRRFQ